MDTILSYNIMQSFKPCSQNNAKMIAQLIKEVELVELPKLVGRDTYTKILADANKAPIPSKLQKILDNGLYACISYLVYSRYCMCANIQDTFTGFVSKNRPDATDINIGILKNEATNSKEIALAYFENVKDDIAKLYDNTCTKVKPSFSIMNVRKRTKNTTDFDTNYFE